LTRTRLSQAGWLSLTGLPQPAWLPAAGPTRSAWLTGNWLPRCARVSLTRVPQPAGLPAGRLPRLGLIRLLHPHPAPRLAEPARPAIRLPRTARLPARRAGRLRPSTRLGLARLSEPGRPVVARQPQATRLGLARSSRTAPLPRLAGAGRIRRRRRTGLVGAARRRGHGARCHGRRRPAASRGRRRGAGGWRRRGAGVPVHAARWEPGSRRRL